METWIEGRIYFENYFCRIKTLRGSAFSSIPRFFYTHQCSVFVSVNPKAKKLHVCVPAWNIFVHCG